MLYVVIVNEFVRNWSWIMDLFKYNIRFVDDRCFVLFQCVVSFTIAVFIRIWGPLHGHTLAVISIGSDIIHQSVHIYNNRLRFMVKADLKPDLFAAIFDTILIIYFKICTITKVFD